MFYIFIFICILFFDFFFILISDDSVCGTLGTQSWIWNMNYTVDSNNDWEQWTDSTGQLGGYMVKFVDAFNFVTVHSAGHMIPETQPMRSLEAFTAYLKGEI